MEPPLYSDYTGGMPDSSSQSSHQAVLAGGGFVGRQREMARLKAALEEAFSGRGRLVMLAGEPGIGKTRTAQELGATGYSTTSRFQTLGIPSKKRESTKSVDTRSGPRPGRFCPSRPTGGHSTSVTRG
ncbi:MAG: AAA family ATPase [Stenotrophomonas maltophilia]